MNDVDRRFLTEWGGECWHERGDDWGRCNVCHQIVTDYEGTPFPVRTSNRTFDNWEDFGWLWGLFCLRSDPILDRFFLWLKEKHFKDATLRRWIILWASERCQLICDFLREQESGDE